MRVSAASAATLLGTLPATAALAGAAACAGWHVTALAAAALLASVACFGHRQLRRRLHRDRAARWRS